MAQGLTWECASGMLYNMGKTPVSSSGRGTNHDIMLRSFSRCKRELDMDYGITCGLGLAI